MSVSVPRNLADNELWACVLHDIIWAQRFSCVVQGMMGVENALSVQVKITNTMTKQIFKIPNPIQGRGGGGRAPPPPPGKLSKISQERLELQSWNFLTFQMNKFSKNAFGFQLSPPTLGYHSNAQRWRMFSNNIFQQFSCKISQALERFLLYLWRVF